MTKLEFIAGAAALRLNTFDAAKLFDPSLRAGDFERHEDGSHTVTLRGSGGVPPLGCRPRPRSACPPTVDRATSTWCRSRTRAPASRAATSSLR